MAGMNFAWWVTRLRKLHEQSWTATSTAWEEEGQVSVVDEGVTPAQCGDQDQQLKQLVVGDIQNVPTAAMTKFQPDKSRMSKMTHGWMVLGNAAQTTNEQMNPKTTQKSDLRVTGK